MQILGLDHIQLAIPVGSERAARRFYGEILGLDELTKPSELRARGGCWFALPNSMLHLGVEPDFHPSRKAHPAFRVADLDAAERHLSAAGVAVTPDTSLPHVRRFYAADPFGNRIEFVQAGDAF